MKSSAALTLLCFVWVCTCSIVTASASAQGQPPSYTVTNLGTPLGGSFAASTGVTPQGLLAGYANLPSNTAQHALLFYKGATLDLGTLGGANSAILANFSGFSDTSQIDPDGQDFCEDGTFAVCVAVTVQDGRLIALPGLTGRSSVAFGNNSIGQAVGVAATSIPDPNCVLGYPVLTVSLPVVWSNGNVHALPVPAPDQKGRAFANNDHGQIVGATGICESNEFAHAVLWQGDQVTVLPSLGGLSGNQAAGINNKGQIVGEADLPGDQTSHAVLWSGGVIHDLGTLPGDFFSFANAINDRGQVVGLSCDASFNCRPFLWQRGAMYDLNALLPTDSTLYLAFPVIIDNSGEIGGYAYDPNTGTLPAFLASVHPEPTGAAGQIREVPRLTLPLRVQQTLSKRNRSMGRMTR